MTAPALVDRFAHDLDGLSDLPALAPMIARLLSTLDRRDVALAEVVQIVREDPGLAAQMLRMANSAAYAGRAPAASIRDALLRLGLREVRRLAMLLAVYNSVRVDPSLVDPGAFWSHSLGVARGTELVAEWLEAEGQWRADGPADSLFLAGLFHDVGLMVLTTHYPKDLFEVRDAATVRGCTFHEVESDVLGTDHTDMSVRLATQRGLSELTIAAMRDHHRAGSGPSGLPSPARVLRLAEALCADAGLPDPGEGIGDPASRDDLGLPGEVLEEIAGSIGREAARAAALFQAAC